MNRITVIGKISRITERQTKYGYVRNYYIIDESEKRTVYFEVPHWINPDDKDRQHPMEGDMVQAEGILEMRNYPKKNGEIGISLEVRTNDGVRPYFQCNYNLPFNSGSDTEDELPF